jgi:hypothetical protein
MRKIPVGFLGIPDQNLSGIKIKLARKRYNCRVLLWAETAAGRPGAGLAGIDGEGRCLPPGPGVGVGRNLPI